MACYRGFYFCEVSVGVVGFFCLFSVFFFSCLSLVYCGLGHPLCSLLIQFLLIKKKTNLKKQVKIRYTKNNSVN